MLAVTWSEARAFARWLTEQIRPQLQALAQLKGYHVALPTEAQWQRAAKASDLAKGDNRTWPWGNNDNDIDQRANVGGLVGESSAVGLYAPTLLGLHDMAGNAWEWMDYEFRSKQHHAPVLRLSTSFEEVSVRGGSWSDRPGHASCSYGNWGHPDSWDKNIGFRVVLALAENET